MPSTDRRLELKAKDIDGSDRLTDGCVCQWVKEVGCGGMDWIELAQDRDGWLALVNAVMNLWVP